MVGRWAVAGWEFGGVSCSRGRHFAGCGGCHGRLRGRCFGWLFGVAGVRGGRRDRWGVAGGHRPADFRQQGVVGRGERVW